MSSQSSQLKKLLWLTKPHEKVAFLPTTNFSCPETYFLLAGPLSPKLIPVSSDLSYTQLGQTLHWASSPLSNIYLLSTYKVPDTSGMKQGETLPYSPRAYCLAWVGDTGNKNANEFQVLINARKERCMVMKSFSLHSILFLHSYLSQPLCVALFD